MYGEGEQHWTLLTAQCSCKGLQQQLISNAMAWQSSRAEASNATAWQSSRAEASNARRQCLHKGGHAAAGLQPVAAECSAHCACLLSAQPKPSIYTQFCSYVSTCSCKPAFSVMIERALSQPPSSSTSTTHVALLLPLVGAHEGEVLVSPMAPLIPLASSKQIRAGYSWTL
eukprot:1160025-Pelagomonas_calceolata.AAC.3